MVRVYLRGKMRKIMDILEVYEGYKSEEEFIKKFVINLEILKNKQNTGLLKKLTKEFIKNKDKLLKIVRMLGPAFQQNDLLIAIVYDKFKNKLNEFNITSKENVLKMKKLVDDLVWIYDNYVKDVYDEYYYMFFYDCIPTYLSGLQTVLINLYYLDKLLRKVYIEGIKFGLRSEKDIVLHFIKGLLELDKIGVEIFLQMCTSKPSQGYLTYLFPIID